MFINKIRDMESGQQVLKIKLCKEFRLKLRACGIYDENGQKNGVWVDIHDKFSKFIDINYN